MTDQNKIETKISFLDWGILFAVIIMFTAIYIPKVIWEEEAELRAKSRLRMLDIANAENFFQELTGNYTTNGEELFSLVEAATDSLISDSLFIGDQKIILKGVVYNVNISKGFDYRVDTTFTNPMQLKRTFLDSIYAVGMLDEKSGELDTAYVKPRDLKKYQDDELFRSIISMDTTSRTEKYTDYMKNKFHLDPNNLVCPIINEKYILSIDQENEIFTVKSPLPEEYTEPRFYIFKFRAGNHGEIIDGERSWAELQ